MELQETSFVSNANRIIEARTFDGLMMARGRLVKLSQTSFISAEPIDLPAAVR